MMKHKVTRSAMPSFAIFQIIFDILAIFCTFTVISSLFYQDGFSLHLNFTLLVIVFFLLAAITRDFYNSLFSSQTHALMLSLLKVWFLGFWSAAILYECVSGFSLSLLFLLTLFIITALLFFIIHKLFSYIEKNLFHPKILNVAFVGRQSQGRLLARNFKKMPWIKHNIIGFYDEDDQSVSGIKRKGNFEQLIKDAKKGLFDQIYIADSLESHKDVIHVIKKLADTTCSVMLLPDIYTFELLRSRIYTINNIPVMSIYDTPFKGLNSLVKRLEDIIGSIIILTLISPILLVIAIAIKMTSKGPILFKQDRYGVNGKIIKVWKFRSMKVMENDHQVKQATKNDPRLTKIGAFLRKTSLDELPQFFNVLVGDMSIVGPRPHAVVHNEQYRSEILGYMLRHKVKPGITGWAQINGYRGETDTLDKMEKRVQYDLEYIRHWSVSFDIKIILLTIVKGFISKTAY